MAWRGAHTSSYLAACASADLFNSGGRRRVCWSGLRSCPARSRHSVPLPSTRSAILDLSMPEASANGFNATETCAFQSSNQLLETSAPGLASTAWDDIDETSRLTALAVLARIIAQMLAADHEKGARDD